MIAGLAQLSNCSSQKRTGHGSGRGPTFSTDDWVDDAAWRIESARRLSGHPVHADTLSHWTDLLHHARRELAAGSSEVLQSLILELESELADRAV